MSGDPVELFDRAIQAREQRDWRTVVLLCGQLLARDPQDPGVVALLTQARDALRQRRVGAAAVAEEPPAEPSPVAESDSTQVDTAEQPPPLPEPPPSPEPQPRSEERVDLPAAGVEPSAVAAGPREDLPAALPPVPPPPPAPAPLAEERPAVEADQPAVSAATPPLATEPAEQPAVGWEPPVAQPAEAVVTPRAATRPRTRAAPRSLPAAPYRTPARGRHYWRLALLGLLAIAVLLVVMLVGPWRSGQSSSLGAAQTTDTPGSVVAPPVASQPTQPAPSPTPAPTAAELFARCEEASAAGSWTEALAACERVRDEDPSYPGLARALATIYLRLAQEKLAQGATPAAQELLERALEYVEKGGVAQPSDAAAAQQRALAQAYQEGQAALASGDWPTAAAKLQQVFDAAPDYGDGATDGGVRKDLLAALESWGEALLAAGDYGEARRRCEQALDLVPTSPEAAACQDAAVAALVGPAPGPAAVVPPGSQQRPGFQPRYPERPKEPQALPSPQQAARY